jgi:hypothetical protein
MKNVKWYVSIVCVLLSIASIGQNKTRKIFSNTKDDVEVTVSETESITLDSKKTKTLSVTAPELANWTVNGKQYAAKESGLYSRVQYGWTTRFQSAGAHDSKSNYILPG